MRYLDIESLSARYNKMNTIILRLVCKLLCCYFFLHEILLVNSLRNEGYKALKSQVRTVVECVII